MKKIIQIPKLIAISVCAVAAVILIVIICINIANRAGGTSLRQGELFFLNSTYTELESETRNIRYKDKADLCLNTLKALIKGPEKKSLKAILSSKTTLLQIDMADEENIVVDFSKEFLTGVSEQDVLSIYAVAKTLCSIDGINSVKVLVEGNEITIDPDGVIGYLTAEDINLAGDINRGEIHEITLYFTKEDTGMLHSEKREVEITDQLPLAQHVVSELIKGPENEEFQGCISDSSTLIGVSISENKCYVDFKNNFLSKNNGSPKHNKSVIYSIVNSLCELENIAQVQFLFEGKKIDAFGDIPLDKLLLPDYELIAG